VALENASRQLLRALVADAPKAWPMSSMSQCFNIF
jgi:hypothetical protein